MGDERYAETVQERRKTLGIPYQNSSTSYGAAVGIGERLTALQNVLFSFLSRRPEGATDDEMQVSLNMNPSTQRPRRIELVERGLVVASGQRKTRSGRAATVWKCK